jgi:sugar phosphate isomerase/epimerase
MNELCFNTMNRSAYLLQDEDPDIEGQIDAAGLAGFECFGPDNYTIQHYVDQGGSREALVARIEAAGMRVFELPTLGFHTKVDVVRADVESMLASVRVMKPDFVQVNISSEGGDVVIDEFRRAGDLFGECGAAMAVEYLPWLPGTKNIETTRDFLSRARVPNAGVLVDTWHFAFSDDTWEILEALPLEEISYIQFDDHPKLESDDLVDETLRRRLMPGEGHFELTRFCDTIRAKGYDRPVSCEILSDATRHMDRLEFARQVHDSSRPYWS